MGACIFTEAGENDYVDHVFKHRWHMTGVELGRGGSGTVHLVRRNKRGSKESAAVKVMDKKAMDKDDVEAIKHEVHLMRKLQHPNIARFIDFFDEKDKMYVVMEYLEGGCLFDRIVQKKHYNELHARDLIYIFLIALKHCHDKGVIHRDLKPENLILSSAKDDANVKIADFGLSIEDDESTIESRNIACGTPLYIAPEMIKAGAGKSGGNPYGKEIDLWACGCLAYILLAGYPPFLMADDDVHNKKLYRSILNGKYDMDTAQLKNVSEEAKDLVKGLLCVNPQQRLTVDQALAHSWVSTARETLAARNLEENLKAFRVFQGKQKFRAGVKALIAAHRLKSVLNRLKSDSEKEKEKEKDEDGGNGDSAKSSSSSQHEHWKEVDPQQVEVQLQ